MSRPPWFLALVVLVVSLAGGAARPDSAKARKYPFAAPPLEMYDRLRKADVGPVEPLPPADAKLLGDFWMARNTQPAKELPQADDAAITLHLLAGGVLEVERADYLKKFTELVVAAKQATAGAKNDREKADRLLRFLHKGVMAKGYAEHETTLHRVFDTGKFNCVSSSCVFYLVGTRLGLKLQPVVIPGTGFSAGHAAVDLIDGKARIQIEPTSPDGYDWPARLKQPGVIVIGPQPDRKKGYDSDGFGLAASIASNLGAEALKARPTRPIEAMRWMTIALVLDPTDATGENNTIAAINNWGKALAESGQFEEAIKVYAFGRAALGAKDLENNYRVSWVRYLEATFAAGKYDEGSKLAPRAAAAFPRDKEFASAGEWVNRAAHRKADQDGWAAGLAYADDAVKHLSTTDAKAVRAWKSEARRQWSQKLLGKGDVDGSLKVIAEGLAQAPDDKELLAGLGYHTQEALAYLDAKKGTPAAVAHFKELCEKFPKNKDVREVGLRHAIRAVEKLDDGKKFDEAMKAADAYEPLAGDRAGELKCRVFDACGRSLVAEGKWDEAIRVYDTGLKQFPDNGRLKNNRDYCVKMKAKG
jgi:tetratricopeptide (TPR) repeat protein